MDYSYKVIRHTLIRGVPCNPACVAEFMNLQDAFYWAKYVNRTKNAKGKCIYFLDCMSRSFPVESLPATYKSFENMLSP